MNILAEKRKAFLYRNYIGGGSLKQFYMTVFLVCVIMVKYERRMSIREEENVYAVEERLGRDTWV